MPHVKITQERSKIRCIETHKRTLEALGLRRIRHSVVHEDTPQIRGMIAKVRYLVRVEAVSGGKKTVSGGKKAVSRGKKGVSRGKKGVSRGKKGGTP